MGFQIIYALQEMADNHIVIGTSGHDVVILFCHASISSKEYLVLYGQEK